MLTTTGYLKIVRASAFYDLIVTAPFVTPWSFGALIGLIGTVHEALGLPGAVPVLDVWHMLFANLLGSVVVVWSLLRLKLNMALLGRFDMAARFLFATWQSYALFGGASWTLIAFLSVEIGFGIAQALPYKRE